MLVFSKASKKNVDNAVAKARQVKPLVRVLGFGKFEVTGSKGAKYTVSFSKNEAGEFVITCGCQANKERQLPCYHAAACSSLFKQQVTARAEARNLTPAQVEVPASLADGDTFGCQTCGEAVKLPWPYSVEAAENPGAVECAACIEKAWDSLLPAPVEKLISDFENRFQAHTPVYTAEQAAEDRACLFG